MSSNGSPIKIRGENLEMFEAKEELTSSPSHQDHSKLPPINKNRDDRSKPLSSLRKSVKESQRISPFPTKVSTIGTSKLTQ